MRILLLFIFFLISIYVHASQDEIFTCDNGKEFPASIVNDNFCDCIDGTDETLTSACPNGEFMCSNKGFFPSSLVTSRLFDGVCDCCDGVDEEPGVCENICKREAIRLFNEVGEKFASTRDGMEEQKDMLKAIPSLRIVLLRKLVKLEHKLFVLEKKFQTLQDEMQASPQKQTQQNIAMYNDMYSKLSQMSFNYSVLIGASELNMGFQGEFLTLFGKCYEIDFQHKKYGDKGVQVDNFIMEICPFNRIVQYDENKKSTLVGYWNATISSSIEYSRQVNKRDMIQPLRYQKKIDPLEIERKVFKEGIPSNNHYREQRVARNVRPMLSRPVAQEDTYAYFPYMIFDSGEKCWNGPYRNAVVMFACGNENKIVEVKENGICSYEFLFQTPAACTENQLNMLHKQYSYVSSVFMDYHHDNVFSMDDYEMKDEL